MKFCSNCGRQIDENAVFCDGCGTNNNGETPETTETVQPAGSGVYTAGTPAAGGSYYPPNTAVPPPAQVPSGAPAPQAVTPPVNQPGTYYQPGAAPTPPSEPQYGGSPQYGTPQFGPASPYFVGAPTPKGGGNKMVIIIIAVVVALALIAGGFFIYSKLAGNKPDKPDSSPSANIDDNVVPSTAPSPSFDLPEPSPSDASGSELFDAATLDNIAAAFDEIGLDLTQATNFEEYSTWYNGIVYTFMYDESVFDMFLYDDGTVFNIETGGVQLYIEGYESFSASDYFGYTSHFDESYPDNGYVFYLTNPDITSSTTFVTSSDMDYVIELIDANTGELVLAFYVQSSFTLSMGVPEGDYIIQYAAGSNWQGTQDLFGDNTYYYKADSIYSFNPDNESTITLDITGGTGIPSTAITAGDF